MEVALRDTGRLVRRSHVKLAGAAVIATPVRLSCTPIHSGELLISTIDLRHSHRYIGKRFGK